MTEPAPGRPCRECGDLLKPDDTDGRCTSCRRKHQEQEETRERQRHEEVRRQILESPPFPKPGKGPTFQR